MSAGVIMSFARLFARVRRPLRRLARDQRGVSAVEFAMLLPLMITLYIGGAEVSRAIAIDRKVTLVSRSLGDLVAQSTSLTSDDVSKILAAATAVMAPYSDTKLKITVSSVKIDNAGVAKVCWSDAKNGGTVRSGNVTLPAALNVANTSLIWAEGAYDFEPVVGYGIIGNLTLKDQIYMRPRLSDSVARTGVTPAC